MNVSKEIPLRIPPRFKPAQICLIAFNIQPGLVFYLIGVVLLLLTGEWPSSWVCRLSLDVNRLVS